MRKLYILLLFILISKVGIGQFSVNLSADDSTVCLNSSIHLYMHVHGASGVVQYNWFSSSAFTYINDSVISVLVSQSSIFTVIATDALNNIDTATIIITALSIPNPTWNNHTDSVCQGSTGIIYSVNSQINHNYKWILVGGGIITSGQNTNQVIINWNNPGNWLLQINDSLNDGCVISLIKNIHVFQMILPNFTFTNNNTCSGTTIHFTNTSSPSSSVKYLWNFGDNTTSTSKNPSHIYNITGNGDSIFNVSLTVYYPTIGCSTDTNFNIIVKRKPSALLTDLIDTPSFTHCATGGSNNTFNLIATDISTTKSTNTWYSIDWGDSTSLYSNSVMLNDTADHTYNTLGTYILIFTVTGQNGCIASNNYSVFNGGNPGISLGNPGSTVACLPMTYIFPITYAITNPPGTKYTISVNDGTPDTVFYQPVLPALPPATFSHTFNSPSCGVTSYSGLTVYPNSFQVTVTAQNPCGASSITVTPIDISSKPIPEIVATPSTVSCVGSQITFQDNTAYSCYFPNIASPPVTVYKRNWIVTPSSGWTNISGTLGNTNPTNDSSTWGSSAIILSFYNPGIYTIQFHAGNNCGDSIVTKNICISPLPVANFNLSDSAFCKPDTVSITNQSTASNLCGSVLYSWKIIPVTITCALSTNYYTYINNTDSTSLNPSILFKEPGYYQLKLIVNNGCAPPDTLSKFITVKSKPFITYTSVPSNICLGNSIAPLVSFSSCNDNNISYLWSFPNGIPFNSTNSIPGSITYATAGTYTYSIKASNSCGDSIINRNIVVYPLPIAYQKTNISYCPGNTISIGSFMSTPSGATFTWVNSNTSIGLAANGSGNISNWTAPQNNTGGNITTTITVIPTLNGCIGTPMSFTVTIYPNPSLTQVSNITVCSGQTINIGNFVSTPFNSSFNWTNSNTNIGLPANGIGNISNWIAPNNFTGFDITGSITVTPNTNGCIGNPMSFTITISPIPIIYQLADIYVCSGSIINIGNFISNPLGGTYTWANSNLALGLASSGIGNIPSWTAPVNISGSDIMGKITVTPTVNSCIGTPMSFNVVIKPAPVINPISNINVCPGQTVNIVNFSASPLSSTFSWTNSNNLIGLVSNGNGNISSWTAPLNNTGNDITGTINVTPTINGCNGESTNFTVNIYPTPSVNSISNISVCPGILIYIGNFSSIPLGANYTWTNTNTLIGISANGIGNIPNWIAPQNSSGSTINGLITVTPALNGCIGTPMNFSVQIYPTPSVNSISNISACPGDLINIANFTSSPIGSSFSWTNNNITIGLASSGNGNISNWIAPQNISGNNINGTINVTPTLNGCVGNSMNFIVQIKQSATINAISNTSVCSGGVIPSQIFTSNPSNATIFWTNNNANIGLAAAGSGNIPSWTAPNNLTTNNFASIITVTPIYNTCIGIPVNFSIVIYPYPTVFTTPDSLSICSGTSIQINLSSPAIETNFGWNINAPLGISGCSSGNGNLIQQTINSTLNNTDTIYYIITPNINGCLGLPKSVPVIINPISIVNFNPHLQTICSGDSTTIISLSSNIIGTTYIWSDSNSAFINGYILNGVGDIPKMLLNNTSNIPLTLIYNITPITIGCYGNPVQAKIIINPISLVTNTPLSQQICSGSSCSLVNLTSNVANTIFNWSVTQSGNITGFLSNGTNQIPSQILTNNGTIQDTIIYHILTSANNCNGDTANYKILVSPLPIADFVLPSTGCQPLTFSFQNQSVPTPLNYLWDFGNGQTSILQNPISSFLNNSNIIDTTYIVKLKVTIVTSGCFDTISHPIVVMPKPKALFSFNTDSICAPAIITVNNTSISKGITTYVWSVLNSLDVQISNNTALSPVFTFNDNQSGVDSIYQINLIVTSSDGCKDTLVKTIKVFSRPKANFVTDSTDCGPITILPTNLSLNSSTYNWSILPNTNTTITTPVSFSPTVTLPVNITSNNITYKLLLHSTNIHGCKDTISQFVNIYPKPHTLFSISNIDSCSVLTKSFINSSLPFNGENITSMTFQWNFGNGNTSTLLNPITAFSNTGIIDSIYQVKLIASTQHGCKDTTMNNVTVHPNPKALFIPTTQISCAPFVINNAVINPQIYPNANDTMKWYVNNNLLGIGNTFPGYTIINAGDSVNVKLITTNIHNCSPDTFQLMFKTINKPIAQFIYNPLVGGQPLTVYFTNQSTPIPLTYSWNFGNGQASTLLNPTINFTNTGIVDSIYQIRLTVTSDSTGCSDTIFHSVIVYALPIVNFNSTDVCFGYPTPFTDSSINTTGIINKWHWDFGNGDTSNIENPVYTYLSPGNYSVNLTITNTNNVSNAITKTVIVYAKPNVLYQTDTLACQLITNVQFINNTINGQTYLWNFGDGNSSVLISPSHIYNNQGYYNIKLIAFSPNQCKDSVSSVIHIIQPPVSDFSLSALQGCSPLSDTIQNLSTGYDLSYFWDFGKVGDTSILAGPFFKIFPQGDYDTTYILRLTTTNICGSVDKLKTIVVKPKPKVNFGMSKSWGCSPVTIIFVDTIRGLPDTLKWDFGDSSPIITSTIFNQQLSHTFFYTGTNDTIYYIKLSAVNKCGSDTLIKQVHVYPNTINAFMEVDTLKGCVPLTVNFLNFSTANTNAFWNFGDGNVSNAQNPSHQYLTAGNYIAQLVVTNGCSYDTIYSDTLIVYPKATPDFSFNDYPCANQVVNFTSNIAGITNYSWSFGDGNNSLLTNPQYTYNTSGNYQVALIINTQHNCVSDTTKIIHIKFTPNASFTDNVVQGCTPLDVQFTNQTDSINFNTYIWKFGNGNTSVLTTPNIQTYNNIDPCNDSIYNIVLIANNSGCKDSSYSSIIVHPVPQIDFTPNNSVYCKFGVPANILFNEQSLCAQGFNWYLDNNQVSTNNNPFINISTEGNHFISLVAYNQYMCKDSITKNFITYSDWKDSIKITPTKGCVPLYVQFNEGVNSLNYEWLFGDNYSSQLYNPNHIYQNIGNYTVKVNVTGVGGCTDSVSFFDTINVYPNPVAAFSENPSVTGILDSKINFIDLSTNAITWHWNFGDGDTSNIQYPSHTYNLPGIYQPLLLVTNTYGCIDSISLNVNIYKQATFYIPNAFTPNNDGLNDEFKPLGLDLDKGKYEMTIYNRWGELIYTSTNPNKGWDGTDHIQNQVCPTGVYVWKIFYTDALGHQHEISGRVTLIH